MMLWGANHLMTMMSVLRFRVFVRGQGFTKAICFGFRYATKSQKVLHLGVFIRHCSLRVFKQWGRDKYEIWILGS